MAPLPELVDDLVAEILLRLPPDDPACLLRASLACKRWRRILADPAFRRRHRALYPAPSVVGFLRAVRGAIPYCSRFVPNNPASGRQAGRDLPGWLVLDCRHGRALFVAPATGLGIEEEEERVGVDIEEEEEEEVTLDFIVWDPLTDERRRLPPPSPPPTCRNISFNAAVLCAAASGGCDHRGCHGGPFRVAFVFTTWAPETGLVTSASVYSSETGAWSRLTSVQRHDVYVHSRPCPSALAGDTLYFRGHRNYTFEYELGAQRLSVIDWPPRSVYNGSIIFPMLGDDGNLGFSSVEVEPSLSLCLWSQGTAPNGVARWARSRAIELEALLPTVSLPPPRLPSGRPNWVRGADVIGFAEGTDVILMAVRTNGLDGDVYMVEFNSGRAKKVFEGLHVVFPCTSFCIPVIDAGSMAEGPEKVIQTV